LGIESMHLTLVKENHNLGYYGVAASFDHEIPVRFVAEEDGVYEFSAEEIGSFPIGEDFYVFDLVNMERFALTSATKYLFQYHTNQPETRFIISRRKDLAQFGESLVQLFPNPTQGDVHLIVNSQQVIKGLTVMNNAGQEVTSHANFIEGSFKRTLSLSNYPAGVYIVRVELESGVVFKRIIKN
jgi:Secretion system C-terminal sorting domain